MLNLNSGHGIGGVGVLLLQAQAINSSSDQLQRERERDPYIRDLSVDTVSSFFASDRCTQSTSSQSDGEREKLNFYPKLKKENLQRNKCKKQNLFNFQTAGNTTLASKLMQLLRSSRVPTTFQINLDRLMQLLRSSRVPTTFQINLDRYLIIALSYGKVQFYGFYLTRTRLIEFEKENSNPRGPLE
ncbi:unnamed protein product [Trichogramma brassicae]|uniref:Uncharacterized protein n=1 Tax=Trichogramma brassicae TaxID=86971 RepID=A0A6H5IGC3_9HYME|nr:unnamed protein product [Trichogramma brassicae]